MKKYFILALCNLVLLCFSCGEFFNTPEHMKGDAWGLRSVEYKQPIVFGKSFTEVEIPYTARVKSNRYELALYFPSNESYKNDSIFMIHVDEILTTLEGLDAQIVDEEAKRVLKSKTIISRQDLSFTSSPKAPLSMSLITSVALEKRKNYKIRLKIPPVRQYQSEFQDIVLILGIGSTPML